LVKSFRLVLSLLFFLTIGTHAAPPLEGKQVFLIVSSDRHDLDGEWLELTLRGMRHELGLSGQEIPVVRMGFDDKDANAQHFERLGLRPEDGPLVCLVQWEEPASAGPREIVDDLLVTGATRELGLVAPRSLFISWLENTGRDNLIPIIAPQPEPVELPTPAQVAFDQRRYEEAIELAREAGMASLEERAKEALRNQALLALTEDRDELADYIVGRWKLVSSSGWVEFSAYRDGRLAGHGALHLVPFKAKMEGHWEVTGATERTFQLHWKNGSLHNVKVHENLQSMEGRGLSDGEVSAKRLGDLES
jgi:hypothetical protein